jgi:hypothetical protein
LAAPLPVLVLVAISNQLPSLHFYTKPRKSWAFPRFATSCTSRILEAAADYSHRKLRGPQFIRRAHFKRFGAPGGCRELAVECIALSRRARAGPN